ncbi:Uncharacterised protein [Chlamydia trachomatis]|nr:Uncharacterised protein [Chlamydia trachomatis]CRH93412.1 Uncharacterised protein [Chlamydia trachomatis]
MTNFACVMRTPNMNLDKRALNTQEKGSRLLQKKEL